MHGGTRPTAVNLRWALERVANRVGLLAPSERASAAREEAVSICDEDVLTCEAIGENGASLLAALAEERGGEPPSLWTPGNRRRSSG